MGRKTQGGIKVDAIYFLKFTTLRRDYSAITESKSPKNKLQNEYILQDQLLKVKQKYPQTEK